MAAMGVDCHAMPRWLTTPLAASAASFHPSKAAIATGFSSGPSTSLNLMTSPPPDHRGLAPLSTAGSRPCLQPTSPHTPDTLPVAATVSRAYLLCPTLRASTLRKPMSGRAITQITERAVALRRALTERVVVADGAMGTMLQASDATIADFRDHEGCNEVLNVTRPDIVRAVHDAYFDAGADCVTTNTFGANLGNLSEYDIP